MSSNFKGGVISATPPTITAPTDGEGGSTSGIWDIDNVFQEEGGSTWPKVTRQGGLFAWGYNSSQGGVLGQSDSTNRSSPIQVGALTTWLKAAMGYECAITTKSDGTLWTWGRNAEGQLGHGGTTAVSSPVQVGSLTNWLQIAAGRYHFLSVKTDGTLWAVGNNSVGQLGDGSTTNRSSPVQIGSLTNW